MPDSTNATAARHQVQVIARAAAILRTLGSEQEGLSLGQIAARVGLARSTVQRIVAALEAEGLLAPASPAGRVRLGPELLRLAASAQGDIAALARPLLAELSAALEETVDLAIIRGDQAVFIDQVVGPQRLRLVSAVGEAFPLPCTANGKAYLATLSDEEVARLVGTRYPRRTPNTHTRLASLLADLAEVRRSGVAFDREEHSLGICAAGVALIGPGGEKLAISVPVPAQRFAGREGEIARRLRATAAQLARRFGSAR
ncbi:MAG: IclR family transcriptional regulator [Rhodovarius sp.]|nr:IclR family transcriptional regulator [Rhodovarius sp.]